HQRSDRTRSALRQRRFAGLCDRHFGPMSIADCGLRIADSASATRPAPTRAIGIGGFSGHDSQSAIRNRGTRAAGSSAMKHQPFTALCQGLAELAPGPRADLHVHSTASDGLYTPNQVIDLARRVGLSAVAITDHDALAGAVAARAAAPANLEVLLGVEITAEDQGREIHLLGYFVSPDDRALTASLEQLRVRRRERFHAMAGKLRNCGAAIDDDALIAADGGGSLGRRNLAELLCAHGRVGSVREAFDRYLADGGPADVPKERLPLDKAIA